MSPPAPPNPLKTVALGAVASLITAAIIGVCGSLYVKLNTVHDSIIRVETILLFHKEGWDKLSTRVDAIERRIEK